jgi:hypothetical protein
MKITRLTMPGLLLALAVPAAAADKVAGAASMNATKSTFAHGVATWHAPERELSFGFFTAPPLGAETPYLLVELVFKEGTTKASPGALLGCHLGFYGYPGGPFDYNGNDATCGLASIEGSLAEGGVVTGRLEGNADIKPMGPLPGRTLSWDATFTSTLRASDASVEMEAVMGTGAVKLPADGGAPGQACLAEKCSRGRAFDMKDCRILGGRQDGDVAILSVEGDTMGSRMRNDFLLLRKGTSWTVEKEGAWRAVP